MHKDFIFPLRKKILFILEYAFSKLFFLWVEVRQNKFRMFLMEMAYSLEKVFHFSNSYISLFTLSQIKTTDGQFKVRPKTLDAILVSPAFERPDVRRFKKLIDAQVKEGKKILVLDIGANLGLYSVVAGSILSEVSGAKILAFEPVPQNLELLGWNIAHNNGAAVVKILPFALGERDDDNVSFYDDAFCPGDSHLSATRVGEQGSMTVKMRRLDSLQVNHERFDVVIGKLDVEGAEEWVLDGARELFQQIPEVWLVVEDFVKTSIVPRLQKEGYSFLEKATPYNSWWYKKNIDGQSIAG